MVARHVASAVGLEGALAVVGVAVHMGLAVALGIVLSAMVLSLAALLARDRAILAFMVGGLAAVWAINFFVVLPVVSPGFASFALWNHSRIEVTSALSVQQCCSGFVQFMSVHAADLPSDYHQSESFEVSAATDFH